MTDEQFITALYLHFLARSPEPAGLQHWLQEIAHGRTRSELVDMFLESAEYARLHARRVPARIPFPVLPGMDCIYPIRICDVGAMCIAGAEHAYQRLLDAAHCEVIGFEPQANELDKRARVEPSSKLLPYVIGDGRSATFYESNKPWGSSCYAPDWKFLHTFVDLGADAWTKAETSTTTRRLDDIEEARGVHFLKMDIQGGEHTALSGAPNLLDSTVAVLHLEVEFSPLALEQPLFSDVDCLVRRHGFELIDFVHLQRYSYRNAAARLGPPTRLLWGDAVYFKSVPLLAASGLDALFRTAFIAHVNYNWYDLAAHLLQACGLGDAYERQICL